MTTRWPFNWKTPNLFWAAVSAVVLVPCLYYPYAGTTLALDFTLQTTDWRVISTPPCPPSEKCAQAGDQFLTFGGVTAEEFQHNRALAPLRFSDPDGRVDVQLKRGDQILNLRVRVREPNPSLGDKLQGVPAALLPVALWLMGTVAVLFLRPRDERWLILVLFSYSTAIWFAAGQVSAYRIGGSGVVFHLLVWFFLPLSIHLHLILPNSLLGIRKRIAVLALLYGTALALSILDALSALSGVENLFIWTTVAALLGSLGLFFIRFFIPLDPAVKVANRTMLYGWVLGLGPFFVVYGLVSQFLAHVNSIVSDIRLLYPLFTFVSGLALFILPMSYVYAIYKHHLGALEFRANRLLGVYSYMAMATLSYVLILFAISSRWAPINGAFLAAVVATSLIFLTTTPFLRSRFQTTVDRHVFGVRHSPEEVIDLVSERIPTAFDRGVLARVTAEEIVPALLIRQSVLYLLDSDRIECLYAQPAALSELPPSQEELHWLLAMSGRYLPPVQDAGHRFGWVRLVIPLTVQARTIGIWLIGRRDPDDYFPASDIHLLSTVANQIAPMAENIRLYERAQQEIAHRRAAEEEIRRSE
ncbi:MAG TPA: GAF domain-containing protein [Candidatus Methylomirabilis sp.]|nr:GAF domain-containing protein [Candidatus Methylomirabilis sp.]